MLSHLPIRLPLLKAQWLEPLPIFDSIFIRVRRHLNVAYHFSDVLLQRFIVVDHDILVDGRIHANTVAERAFGEAIGRKLFDLLLLLVFVVLDDLHSLINAPMNPDELAVVLLNLLLDLAQPQSELIEVVFSQDLFIVIG